MLTFYAAPDHWEDAICRIHYSDRWDACNCTNPWTGMDCANTQYSKIVELTVEKKV